MKQIFTILLVFVIGMTKVNAQYFNPYFCNPYAAAASANIQQRLAEQAQLAAMRAQTQALYMQTMQMHQARVAAAAYNVANFQFNPAAVPVTMPAPTRTVTTNSRQKVTCGFCGGIGHVTRSKASYSLKRMVTVREICSECHGKGYNRE